MNNSQHSKCLFFFYANQLVQAVVSTFATPSVSMAISHARLSKYTSPNKPHQINLTTKKKKGCTCLTYLRAPPIYFFFSFQNCWNCGRRASETCSGCNKARYCGEFCQHKDWLSHMHQCASGLPGEPSLLEMGLLTSLSISTLCCCWSCVLRIILTV